METVPTQSNDLCLDYKSLLSLAVQRKQDPRFRFIWGNHKNDHGLTDMTLINFGKDFHLNQWPHIKRGIYKLTVQLYTL